ncbi:MAG: succinyl-diaminopimelate desuccinylase [Gammaproteobacteria bacterium]|nr:succinyl-diaminopimelate desuccinylase [Gammaproteobacteria bacterium]MYE28104.1 succinyl-diaminopimelate desuccinylase [Gammaproteobacteria bacterium]MYI02221.1 succinyl-diaminopimelate desuccinylase [Gammaproteobacteria bacterium]
MSATFELAADLIRLPSVTPEDAGCQELLRARLEALGFTCETMQFGEVTNLWATLGDSGPLLVFAGHTDVVPPGPRRQWHSDPFEPEVRDGKLYGRGAADMKGAVAAMVTAAEDFLADNILKHRLGYLITSDEEGPAVDGTARVMDELQRRGEKIDYCLVGEPSCVERLGDTVKIGRRGSINGLLTVKGLQGHVAYPQQSVNPIHEALPALTRLIEEEWDRGNASFPPTCLQISNINAGAGADNVIPGTLEAQFNLRYSPEIDADRIRERVARLLNAAGFDYEIDWHESGRPFLTESREFADRVAACIEQELGVVPERSTSGGTSDGRFIAPTGTQVVEFGPCNESIHRVNENVALDELDALAGVYRRIMESFNTDRHRSG